MKKIAIIVLAVAATVSGILGVAYVSKKRFQNQKTDKKTCATL